MHKRTMHYFQTSRRALAPALVLALLAAFTVAGCDTSTEADDADFAVLARQNWTVQSFRVGGTDRTSRLKNQFDSDITFEFTEDDSGDREFGVFARISGGEDNFRLEGEVRIEADDDELTFQPYANISDFDVQYDIRGENRLVLRTEEDDVDGRILREILIPGSNIGDEFPSTRLVLAR